MGWMRVAVIDVGSNIRLLVATVAAEGLRRVHERTARAVWGRDRALHGMTTATIEAAAATVGRFADEARELGAGVVVVAASPAGRPRTLGGLSSGSRGDGRRRARPLA
jgi:exopolyphosphatase/pppGpp-phosphohydrolase